MGVKNIVCTREKLLPVVTEAIASYDSLRIFLPGSPEHSKRGLSPEHILIRAWNSKTARRREEKRNE
jgi:hypothetical protein